VDLCYLSARELARMIRARELSAREVMRAHLDRIAAINPQINAIVAKLDDDRCLRLADDADARLARGEIGPLHGLPFAFKDLEDAVGFPNTKGSPIFAGFLPAADSVLVNRIRTAGAIPIGKTNVPEFAMGSHTYNKVYGTTRNPYDLSKTAGGSSGGAAAALAAGLVPLADGSDLGGSLRNPGNFNNVVGFRPSIGVVPDDPDSIPGINFSVKGPLARSVDDVAFFFDVIAEVPAVPRVPRVPKVRVAWSVDLGGLPVDERVRAVLENQTDAFDAIGCTVEYACPDLRHADEIFLTMRRFRSFQKYGELMRDHRAQMKPEAIDEIERGARVTADELARATRLHAELLERAESFFDTYDCFACAVNQVPPFDADLDWPKAIDGVEMDSYTAWMKSAYWVSVLCGPAISVPCGFTAEGLPVGIQLVARRGDDRHLLELARSFESVSGTGKRRPNLVTLS
jgi:amidase